VRLMILVTGLAALPLRVAERRAEPS